MSDKSTVLEITNLRVTAESEKGDVHAVSGVTLSLKRGEVLGLVGESGSGKSMLSKSVMGLHNEEPGIKVTGSAMLQGIDVVETPVKQLREIWGKTISIVLQDPLASLNPVRRIGPQIEETILKHQAGISKKEAKEKAVNLLRMVGIADPERRMRVYPHEMSGGMRQRVMIAVALSGDPQVLIADEPTTALDVTVQAQILDLLDRERVAREMAIIFVTHDLSLVASRTHRVAVMYAGEIVEEAKTSDLFAGPLMPYTRALLEALPPMEGPIHVTLAAIPGSPPDPTQEIIGCRFASRCPIAQEVCTTDHPKLLEHKPDHFARCHFALQPADGDKKQ